MLQSVYDGNFALCQQNGHPAFFLIVSFLYPASKGDWVTIEDDDCDDDNGCEMDGYHTFLRFVWFL